MAREWRMIISTFNVAERRMNGPTNSNIFFSKTLPALHSVFSRAVILRLPSLGIESKPTDDLFLRLKRLAHHGFDMRNPAWRNLVDLRNYSYHDGRGDPTSRIEAMKSQMGELRQALERLDPLPRSNRGRIPRDLIASWRKGIRGMRARSFILFLAAHPRMVILPTVAVANLVSVKIIRFTV